MNNTLIETLISLIVGFILGIFSSIVAPLIWNRYIKWNIVRKNKLSPELSIAGKWMSTFAEDGQIYKERVEIIQKGRKIEALLDLNQNGKNYKYNFTGEYKNKILTGSYNSSNKRKDERGTIIVQNVSDELLFGYATAVPINNKSDIQQSPYILTRVNEHEAHIGTFDFCATCIGK